MSGMNEKLWDTYISAMARFESEDGVDGAAGVRSFGMRTRLRNVIRKNNTKTDIKLTDLRAGEKAIQTLRWSLEKVSGQCEACGNCPV